jgi:hypothetical protein
VEEPDDESSGFFVEEEDETIALTGDELDNILSTADITEETGEETETPDDQDLIDFPVDIDTGETGPAVGVEEAEPDIALAEEPILEAEEPEIALAEEPILEAEEPEIALAEEPILEAEEPEIALAEEPLAEVVEDESGLLIDREDIIPLEVDEETDLDDIDLDEPEVDTADQTEIINLDESDELLGEILPAEEDLLDEELSVDAGTADLEIEPIDLEEDVLTPSLESEEPEELLLEDEEGGMEGEFELEEILDEEIEEPQVEELELDIENAPAEAAQMVGDDIGTIALDASEEIPDGLKEELRSVLSYMDHLLESLPEDKIQEFAQSEHFETYKKLFEELGLES